MRALYEIAGVSKQAYFKSLKRQDYLVEVEHKVIENFQRIRKKHKRMGCRKMVYVSGYDFPVGRDQAERIGFAHGYKLKRKRNPVKTTWAQRIEVYDNLIDGMELNNINQVWQSDIFYVNINGRNYYGIGIIDVYSRNMLSLHLSNSLSSQQNEKALKQAIKQRRGQPIEGCIFHSDRGSQYISQLHKSLLKEHKMKISMCKQPQENAYAERLNGILKNDYIYPLLDDAKSLVSLSRSIRKLYNEERPHSELNNMTPKAFEQMINTKDQYQRPKMSIHKWNQALSTENQVINKEKSYKKEI